MKREKGVGRGEKREGREKSRVEREGESSVICIYIHICTVYV